MFTLKYDFYGQEKEKFIETHSLYTIQVLASSPCERLPEICSAQVSTDRLESGSISHLSRVITTFFKHVDAI